MDGARRGQKGRRAIPYRIRLCAGCGKRFYHRVTGKFPSRGNRDGTEALRRKVQEAGDFSAVGRREVTWQTRMKRTGTPTPTFKIYITVSCFNFNKELWCWAMQFCDDGAGRSMEVDPSLLRSLAAQCKSALFFK
jgi:hypothetical protein